MVVIFEIEDEQPKLPKHLVALPVESMSLEVPRSSRMAGAGRLLKLALSENISGFQFEFTQKRRPSTKTRKWIHPRGSPGRTVKPEPSSYWLDGLCHELASKP